jgi:hypothetical protein
MAAPVPARQAFAAAAHALGTVRAPGLAEAQALTDEIVLPALVALVRIAPATHDNREPVVRRPAGQVVTREVVRPAVTGSARRDEVGDA